MRKQSRCVASLAILLGMMAGLAAPAARAQAGDGAKSATSRLAVYEQPSGEKYFALSLTPAPDVFGPAARAKPGVDVVVLFDTSASQAGRYRTDALAALRTLLAALAPQDRVKLMAVDLNAIDLSGGFVGPTSPEMQTALAQLERREPLGSTDMAAALRATAESFTGAPARPRAAVYVGDGMSKANFLATEEFGRLVEELTNRRTSFHSYAIGPQRDMQLLAVLANHTGGMMYADSKEENGQRAGASLAQVVHVPVFWPTEPALPPTMKEVYPQRVPPFRSDRDTILVGVLEGEGAQPIAIRGEVNGIPSEAKWTVQPEKTAEDLSYLPKLLEMVRRDGGLTLPTAGSDGLREVGRLMLARAEKLAEIGARELSRGNLSGAKTLSDAARAVDPNNPHATTVQNAVRKAAEDSEDPELRLIHLQEEAEAPPAEPPPAPPPGDGAGLGEGFDAEGGLFLQDVLEQQRIQEQILAAEVQEGLRQARDIMGTAPERAIQDLKFLLQSVEAARDVRADFRVQLRNQIAAAIQEANRVGIELTAQRAQREEAAAQARQQQRLTQALLDNQEKIENLMLRFNALMDEGEFVVAEQEVATQVVDIATTNDMTLEQVVGVSAVQNARLIGNYSAIMTNRDLRDRRLFETLFLVEQSHVPFPDEPPIVYPDPAFWESLNERKEKYGSVDLAVSGPAEQKIFSALDDITTLEFLDTPLADVIEFLKDAHEIPIEIDTKALDDVGLTTDVPVTRNLKGITLRSALRLMLRELDLTYMVRDEVLLITTPEEAETQLVTKVYPVADLVLPIISGGVDPFQGGGGGFGGGGGNFNGGGGGGGFGGGGGGFGGGGLGGGGGFFDVKDGLTDDLNLGVVKKNAAQPAVQTTASTEPRVERPRAGGAAKFQPIVVTPQPGATVAQAWDLRFAEAKEPFDPAAVRETARQLMNKRRFEELIAMLQAALRHGQPQPWMYEAMGLAMQAAGSSKQDLERALMSAVDFSEDLETVMYVAAYLSHVGLDDRALALFQEVSAAAPHRHEPYVRGLAIAQRLGDVEGKQWACLGILNQAWPNEQRSIPENAARAAKATLLELRQAGETERADRFEQALREAQSRDVRIVVTWTGDADIDLMVEEPSGAMCSLRNQRTLGGGVLLGDTYASSQGAGVNGYREVYECPYGFSGVYRLLLRRIWGKATAGQAVVDIYTHYGTQQQQHIRKTIPLGEKDALILFDLADGRRQEPLEEAQIEHIARAQMETNRAILAQQLSQMEDSSASRLLARDRGRRVAGGALPARSGRGVGFRPVITTLPEGTNFQATAVISADRRYVRVTATPLFSLVGDVTTFNFATGQSGGGGGGGGGIGGGIGGIGGIGN